MAGKLGHIVRVVAELVVGTFVLVGLLALLVVWKLGEEQQSTVSIEGIQMQQGIPVEVCSPQRRNFEEWLFTDGEVVADTRTFLRAKVDEVVEAVHVQVGEAVKRGQLLVEMRADDLNAAVDAAEAAYEEAASNYERYRNLRDEQVISENRVEEARTGMENAAAALRAARSRRTFAEVRSPIDGYIEARYVEPGEFKGIGKELLSAVDLSMLQVRALVPEAYVSQLAVGDQANFQIEAHARWRSAKIRRISPATNNPNRFFDVFLVVQNEPEGNGWLMRPGMYAQVRFTLGRRINALAVPDHTVVLEGAKQAVYVVSEATARVTLEAEANPGEDDKEKSDSLVRLQRGWRNLLSRFGGGDMAQEDHYREKKVLKAFRNIVQTGLRQQGYVELVDASFDSDDRIICNPRDAVSDGAIVRIVDGGGG